MPIRNVYVKISHKFEVDIPDELLLDENSWDLDMYLADKFEDTDWVFDEIVITDGNGNYV